jgi:hypothetical protein
VVDEPCSGQELKTTGDPVAPESIAFTLQRSLEYLGVPQMVPVDCGVVEAGGVGVVVVDVLNRSESDFHVQSIEVGCGCVQAKMEARTLRPGETSKLLIQLTAPQDGRTIAQNQLVRVIESNERMIQVLLKYEVGGMCCFQKPSITAFAPRNAAHVEFTVPILLSSAVEPSSLQIRATGELSDGRFALREKDGEFIVECKLNVPMEGEFTRSGQLFLENPKAKTVSTTDCFVRREPSMTITPSRVPFFRKGDSFQATAMLRVGKNLLPQDPGKPCVVSGALGSLPMTLEAQEVSRGAWRVKLSIPAMEWDQRNDEELQALASERIRWQVSWTGGIAEGESPVFFEGWKNEGKGQ